MENVEKEVEIFDIFKHFFKYWKYYIRPKESRVIQVLTGSRLDPDPRMEEEGAARPQHQPAGIVQLQPDLLFNWNWNFDSAEGKNVKGEIRRR